jgi:uncharacterized protein YndB with AHSA1/START domain
MRLVSRGSPEVRRAPLTSTLSPWRRTAAREERQSACAPQAWTQPEHLTKWWGPRGFTTPLESIRIDLRPGGRLDLTMVQDSDGTEYVVELNIEELEPPERFTFSWGDTENPLPQAGAGIATVTFADRGDKTEMTFHQSAHNTEEGHGNAEAGWSQSIDRLGAELAP